MGNECRQGRTGGHLSPTASPPLHVLRPPLAPATTSKARLGEVVRHALAGPPPTTKDIWQHRTGGATGSTEIWASTTGGYPANRRAARPTRGGMACASTSLSPRPSAPLGRSAPACPAASSTASGLAAQLQWPLPSRSPVQQRVAGIGNAPDFPRTPQKVASEPRYATTKVGSRTEAMQSNSSTPPKGLRPGATQRRETLEALAPSQLHARRRASTSRFGTAIPRRNIACGEAQPAITRTRTDPRDDGHEVAKMANSEPWLRSNPTPQAVAKAANSELRAAPSPQVAAWPAKSNTLSRPATAQQAVKQEAEPKSAELPSPPSTPQPPLNSAGRMPGTPADVSIQRPLELGEFSVTTPHYGTAAAARPVDELPASLRHALSFLRHLPVLPCTELSGDRRPLLPPLSPEEKLRPSLVLDLDETLVHCSREGKCPRVPSDRAVPPDLIIEFEATLAYGSVSFRPFVKLFLEVAAKAFEITVFTASQQTYADKVINALDPTGTYISHRLYRQHCTEVRGAFFKELGLLGRPLSQCILVDNSPISVACNPDHGVLISSWYGDRNDRELMDLLGLLQDIRVHQGGTDKYLAERYGLREFFQALRESTAN